MTISDLVFGLGPLINSAGRLGDARDAVRLLLSADKQSALDNAASLVERNRVRREVDFAMANEVRRQLTDLPDWEERKTVVLYEPSFHKGIIGIAASRISEEFYKPSVILTHSEGRAVGSARSVRGFDLYAALQQCEDLFYSFGGHAHAAGMQMPPENVPAFAEKFEHLAQTILVGETALPLIEVAGELDFTQITPQFWRILKQFAPFGPQNLNPIFCARKVMDTGGCRLLNNNHVKFLLRQHEHGPVFSGIGFGLGTTFAKIDRSQPFDLIFNIQEEKWRGETVLSLQVKDVKQ